MLSKVPRRLRSPNSRKDRITILGSGSGRFPPAVNESSASSAGRVSQFRPGLALSQMGIGPSRGRTYGVLRIRPVITQAGIDLYAQDMWTFIRVAFVRDLFLKRPRICANQAYGCPSPYFLESRKGQTFCCHRCAVQMNVRRFRERENKKRK